MAEPIERNKLKETSVKRDTIFLEGIWHTIDTHHFWQGEIVNRKKDGTDVYEHVTVMKLVEGDSTHYISAISDISERL